MSNKGNKRRLKRVSTPSALPIRKKKNYVWISRPLPSKHAKDKSIALSVLLRDVLGIAKDHSEAKSIIKKGIVKVDNKTIREPRYSIGLMDCISIDNSNQKLYYRMLATQKGLRPVSISEEDAKIKLKKVIRKNTVKNGKTQLTFNDGTTILTDNQDIRVNDTVVFSLQDNKILKVIKFELGQNTYVTDGKHVGKVVKLLEVIPRPGSHDDEAKIEDAEGTVLITTKRYLFPVDEKHFNYSL